VAIRCTPINPFAASSCRDRHVTSGAKSDPGDAKVLADLVRTDRHNHRRVAGDSAVAEAIKFWRVPIDGSSGRDSGTSMGYAVLCASSTQGALLAFGTDLDTGDARRSWPCLHARSRPTYAPEHARMSAATGWPPRAPPASSCARSCRLSAS
jgi:hypothetical protein